MKRIRSRSEKISLAISISFHALIVIMLGISFDKTIRVSAPPSSALQEQKPIIDAVMVSKKSLQEEVRRLEQKEAKKREQEENRLKEIAQKEIEIKEREKAQALAIELKKKNEELKKEAERKKLAEEKKEKEKQAKKKEEELKKAEKEKEEALKKADLEKKAKEKLLAEQQAKELAEQQQAKEAALKSQENNPPSPRISQQDANRHASLIRAKIHQNWRKPIGFDYDGMTCTVSVTLLPTGDVVEAVVVKSSGSVEFDRSAELAVKKASPLPMPEDSNLAKEFRQFNFLFRSEAA